MKKNMVASNFQSATQGSLISAAVIAVCILFKVLARNQYGTFSQGLDYFLAHWKVYSVSTIAAGAATFIMVLMYHMKWTKFQAATDDLMNLGALAVIAWWVILFGQAIVLGCALMYDPWLIPGVTDEQTFWTAIALAVLSGLLGRGFGLVYFVTTMGMVLTITAKLFMLPNLCGLFGGAVLAGYLVNRTYWLIFVKKWGKKPGVEILP